MKPPIETHKWVSRALPRPTSSEYKGRTGTLLTMRKDKRKTNQRLNTKETTLEPVPSTQLSNNINTSPKSGPIKSSHRQNTS